MYGVCEAWRGVLPSPAPAAYCGQVKRRHQRGTITAIHAHRSQLPSHSTLMKKSHPAVCELSRREGDVLVSAPEFPLCSSSFWLFLSSSSSSSSSALICTSLL